MLSTSSDLFTLASEMCACSREVERIYDDTSSISMSRVTRVHDVDELLLSLCVAFRHVPATCARIRATPDEGTTVHAQSGGYRDDCASRVRSTTCCRAHLRARATRPASPTHTRPAFGAGVRTRRSPANGPGSCCSPEQIRTAVTALRGRRPRPLDDGAKPHVLQARGGGLEPPKTGPEPVVLPITPPPKVRPD